MSILLSLILFINEKRLSGMYNNLVLLATVFSISILRFCLSNGKFLKLDLYGKVDLQKPFT